MPKLITKKFGLHVADIFQKNIGTGQDNFYIFYSRVHPWPSEQEPPTPIDTVQYTEYDVWRGMVGLKKISNNDVSFAISRYNWTANTVYAQYSNVDPNLTSKQYFVYTSNNNVYKCLYNNGGSPSTVQPTGQSTSSTSTSDGYTWKFMYNVTSAEQNRYQSGNFVPVKKLTSDDSSPQWAVQQAAANGSVDVLDVIDGGSNYLIATGNVTSVTNTSVFNISTGLPTDNIYKNYSLFISSGLGAGQNRRIKQYRASDKKITLQTPFDLSPNTQSTFHIAPTINIHGDGSGAQAYANVISGEVVRVNVIDGGSNYSRASANVTHYGPTTGLGAQINPLIAPPGGHGSDPIIELNGTNIVINALVDGTENGKFVANNDFRIYGLVKNPVELDGTRATDLRYNQTTRLTMTGVSGSFLLDEFVSGDDSGALGRVVEFAADDSSGVTGVLKLTNVSGGFSNTEAITANTSGTTGTISGVAAPELLPFRGEVLYTVNQVAISRDVDQTENITITVKF